MEKELASATSWVRSNREITKLVIEKKELEKVKDWAVAKADAHEEDIALLRQQIKALCKETLDEAAPDHPSIHVMNEMNDQIRRNLVLVQQSLCSCFLIVLVCFRKFTNSSFVCRKSH